MSDIVSVEQTEDHTDKFGRRELIWITIHRENVHWVEDHYHCSKCGQDFSDKEGTMQDSSIDSKCIGEKK